jgi:hypothetical protein
MSETSDQIGVSTAIAFIRRWPRLYANWTDQNLADFLMGQASQDGVRLISQAGPAEREITGIMVGWKLHERNLHHPQFLDGPHRFPLNDPGGNVFYCELLVALPGATRALVADHQWRFPNWRSLRVAAVRRGKLKLYPPEQFSRRLENI